MEEEETESSRRCTRRLESPRGAERSRTAGGTPISSCFLALVPAFHPRLSARLVRLVETAMSRAGSGTGYYPNAYYEAAQKQSVVVPPTVPSPTRNLQERQAPDVRLLTCALELIFLTLRTVY